MSARKTRTATRTPAPLPIPPQVAMAMLFVKPDTAGLEPNFQRLWPHLPELFESYIAGAHDARDRLTVETLIDRALEQHVSNDWIEEFQRKHRNGMALIEEAIPDAYEIFLPTRLVSFDLGFAFACYLLAGRPSCSSQS